MWFAKALCFLPVFSFLVLCTNGQDSLLLKRSQLKFSIHSLVNLADPAFELSYERRINRYATEIVVGTTTSAGNNLKQRFVGGYTFTIEEKYFTHMQQRRLHPFVSLRFRYYQRMSNEITFGQSPSFQRIEDPFVVQRKTYALSANSGLQLIKGNAVVQLSGGFGCKYNQVRHDDRQLPVNGPREFFDFIDQSNREQSRWILIVPITCKLGLVF